MYKPRIGIVAEGPTDYLVIEAALDALLPVPYVPTLLQPDETRPKVGQGWGGVFRWIRQTHQRDMLSISDDPLLAMFDLIIVHLDADVCRSSYQALGLEIKDNAAAFMPLPCDKPCPPAQDSVQELERVIQSWIAPRTLGDKATLCIPSRSIEAWLAVAVLPAGHHLLDNVECRDNLDRQMKSLPVATRIKKTRREYQQHKATITAQRDRVRSVCRQADEFSRQLPMGNLPINQGE
jgi:hypothetical protein